ncbi:MAG: hypothetical protein ACUVRA_00880 [Candidatus Bathyarchaeaceae archaeon]
MNSERFALLISVLLLFSASSIFVQSTHAEGPSTKWTFMVYYDIDNDIDYEMNTIQNLEKMKEGSNPTPSRKDYCSGRPLQELVRT